MSNKKNAAFHMIAHEEHDKNIVAASGTPCMSGGGVSNRVVGRSRKPGQPGARLTRLCLVSFIAIVIALFTASTPSALMKGKSKKPAKPQKPKTETVAKNDEEPNEEGPEAEEGKGGEVCKAEILIDAKSGAVLFEKNAHESLPPASMVKMMTVLVTMKMVKEGKVKLDDIVPVSAAASRIGGSQVYLKQGEEFRLEDMLKAIMICSANDAAFAVSEFLGGSPEGFVDLMRAEAKAIGMNESHFYSVHGLPPDPGQEPDIVSAYDMALLGRTIILQTPELLNFSSIETAPFRDGQFIMHNVNKMLGKYRGLDGLKTGFYNRAGFCITATAKRDNDRYIAVVMGCATSKQRFNEVARLLNMGFNLFTTRELAKKGAPFNRTLPVENGEKKEVKLAYADDLTVIFSRNEKDKIKPQETYSAPKLEAPVKMGTKVGAVSFKLGEKDLGSVDLLTAEDIPELSWVRWIGRKLGLN